LLLRRHDHLVMLHELLWNIHGRPSGLFFLGDATTMLLYGRRGRRGLTISAISIQY
jgi:hypothetical protein